MKKRSTIKIISIITLITLLMILWNVKIYATTVYSSVALVKTKTNQLYVQEIAGNGIKNYFIPASFKNLYIRK